MSVGQKKIKKKSLKELKIELLSKTLPKEIQFGPGQKITDVKKFIDSHISVLEGNTKSNNKITFMPYYDRLVQLNSILN